MANKWAVQNGNWSDGSTWNDGVVPTADDDVWLNGKTVTVAADIYALSVRNLENQELSVVDGGHINATNNVTINANLFINNESMIQYSYRTITVQGDSYVYGNASILYTAASGSPSSFYYNGNIHSYYNGHNFLFYYGYGTINGNIDAPNAYLINFMRGGDFHINGNISILELLTTFYSVSNIYITGVLKLFSCDYQLPTNLYITGTIEIVSKLYVDTLNIDGVIKYSGIGDTFGLSQTKNIKIIHSNIELINLTKGSPDYPAESDVKLGVKYGYDNYEGQYTAVADYPQEATVLKDVEYDNGNKVGTLEVIALSGATATADNISVVNLTEQQLQRVGNCATVSTVQKCFEDFKEE